MIDHLKEREMSNAQTVADLSLEDLFRAIREEVTQTVITLLEPLDGSPESDQPESEQSPKAMRAYDVTDSEKVARSKAGKASSKFWGSDGPQAPATFRMRKRIAAFADLKSGGTAVSDRIFKGSLTRAQATVASSILESGRSVRIDDLEIDPR